MKIENKANEIYELAKKIYLTDTENSTYSIEEIGYDYCDVYSILKAIYTSLSKILEHKISMDMERIEAERWNTSEEVLDQLNEFKIISIEHSIENIKNNLINLDRLCRKYNYLEICGIKSNNNLDYFKFAIELQKESFNFENFVIDILKKDITDLNLDSQEEEER